MTGTPDRFPGTREETELLLRAQASDPTDNGASRYVTPGDFAMRDQYGVFNPRSQGQGSGQRIIQVSLTGDGQAKYQSITQSTWEVLGYMAFPGTAIWGTDGTNCAGFVAWMITPDVSGIDLRMYDVTNGNIVATVTGITTTVPTIHQAASVSNLSSAAAVWEIQGKRNANKNGACSVACLEKRSS